MATTVIDNKVVEMRFDNKDFEKNINQSLLSLDKLKNSLNMDSAKALDNLGKAANGFQLNGMTSAIETVQARFSALQIVGITVLQELTRSALNLGSKIVSSFISPIKEGGMRRALNIEQAKFQLEGLGVAWKEIEEDINYGVKDTAYGLDSAAKAAAQLTASGVTLGDNMKAALRGISGVAAMTNATYDEISPIFTTVAGQGKLMTMQLRQLEARGLNAAATLGKVLDKSEAEIRDMVTKGEIDFQTFANAMDEAFGAHAKDANKTFTGAMSNVKAAMSRIGANFAQPYMENMRLIFVESIKALNNLNKALDPVVGDVTKIMEMFQKRITNFLSSTGLKNGTISIVNSFRNAFYSLLLVAEPIRKAFRDIFPAKDMSKGFENAAKALENFTSKLVISEENAQKIHDTFKGVFAVFDILKQAFSALFTTLKPITGGLSGIFSTVLDFTSGIGRYLVALDEFIKSNHVFEEAFASLADKATHAKETVLNALGFIEDGFKKFKAKHIDGRDFSGFTNFISDLKSRIPDLNTVGNAIGKLFEGISNVFAKVGPTIIKLADFIGNAIGTLLKSSSQALGPGNEFAALFNTFSSVMVGTIGIQIAEFVGYLTKSVQKMGGLSTVISNINGTLKQVQADIRADVIMKIAKAIAVFAGSLLVLSLIDPGRMAMSLAAVEILIVTMSKMADLFYAVSSSGGLFKSLGQAALLEAFGTALTKLAVAIGVLALSVKVLSGIDILHLTTGMVAMEIILKSLVDQAVLLTNIDTKMMQGAACMIALAVGIRILASAVAKLGSLSLPDLLEGMTATLLLLKALTKMVKKLEDTKLSVGTGVAIIAIAASLVVLTHAVKALGELDLLQLIQGGVAVSVLLLALGGFVKLASGSKGMVAAALGILAAAGALKVLVSVVDDLGTMDFNALVQGGIAMAGLLAALLLFSKFTNGGNLLVASAAILLLSGAISSLTKSIEALGNMSIGNLIKAFVTLTAVIAAFAGATDLLTPILVPMAALAGIITLLGVGVLALGAGILTLSAGLAGLATAATAVVANLGAILTIISVTVPAIFTALANGILQFVAVITNNFAVIGRALTAVGAAMLDGIIELTPKLVDTFTVLLQALVDTIVNSVPILTQGALDLISGFLEGLAAGMPRLAQAMHDFAMAAINGFADSIRNNTDESIAAFDNLMDACIEALGKWFHHFADKGGEIITKMIEGIESYIDEVKREGKKIIDQALEGIKQNIKDVVQLGKDFVNGFIEGIKEAPGKVWDAAKGLVNNALSAVQKTQNSNSPAKETQLLGGDFGDGYALGIDNSSNGVMLSAKDMVQAALNPLSDGCDDATNKSASTAKAIIANLNSARAAAAEMNPVSAYFNRYTNSVRASQLSTEGLKKEMKELKDPTSEVNKKVKEATDNQNDYAAATGKATKAAKEQKSFLDTMKDTLTNQMDIFSKFEMKTGVTAQQMLDNMKSNLDGFASWSTNLAKLAERGIDQALYKKLAEMGPKGYETLNAFVQMTDEQLAKANEMFAQSLSMPESQAGLINAGFIYAGEMAVQGFSNALSDYTGTQQAANGLGQAALDGITEALDIHSPSKKTFEIGVFALKGLENGIDDPSGLALILLKIRMVCRSILGEFQSNMKSDDFFNIGKNAIQGLANGLADTDAASKVMAKAAEIGAQAAAAMRASLDEHSPSKVTELIGRFATLGLAKGITKDANKVVQASHAVGDMAALGLQDAVNTISNYIDMNLNPVITPILDLSYMDHQLQSINSSFGVKPAAGQIQNGESIPANGAVGGITYNQYNYSPKELSRLEIRRQTQNQLSTIGRVVKKNYA